MVFFTSVVQVEEIVEIPGWKYLGEGYCVDALGQETLDMPSEASEQRGSAHSTRSARAFSSALMSGQRIRRASPLKLEGHRGV